MFCSLCFAHFPFTQQPWKIILSDLVIFFSHWYCVIFILPYFVSFYHSETDQLYKICTVLGTPDCTVWPEGMYLPRSNTFKFFQVRLASILVHWIKCFAGNDCFVFLSDRYLQETYGSLFLMLLWKQLTWSRCIEKLCLYVVWLWI